MNEAHLTILSWRHTKVKNAKVEYFSPEEEYTRFIIGRFKDEGYVPFM